MDGGAGSASAGGIVTPSMNHLSRASKRSSGYIFRERKMGSSHLVRASSGKGVQHEDWLHVSVTRRDEQGIATALCWYPDGAWLEMRTPNWVNTMFEG